MPTFHFELVSPDKVLFNSSAQAVLVPGAEGDFQVLSDHAPVMTAMRAGVVGIDDAEASIAECSFAAVLPTQAQRVLFC